MLKQRVLSAIVMLVVFLTVNFVVPDSVFVLALSALAGVAGWEWSRLNGVQHLRAQMALGVATFLIALLSILLLPLDVVARWFSLLGLIFWICIAMVFYFQPVKASNHAGIDPTTGIDPGQLLIGFVLLPACSFFIYYLHTPELGGSAWLVIYALAIVWTMDTGAYFSGKRLGKTKLAPAISPGKTWEGVAGGLICAVLLVVCVLIFSTFFRQHLFALLVGTLLAAIASILGDLYESRLKRAAGIKDSSQLIPGHGGILDRIDGVLAALPVFSFAWIWL